LAINKSHQDSTQNSLLTSDFDYQLPPEYIAQKPLEPRDASRLMVIHRDTGKIEHRKFYDLGEYLQSGDVLVVNETKVILARLFASKIPSGGKVELLLLRKITDDTWEVLIGGKGIQPGRRLQILSRSGAEIPMQAEVVAVMDGARRLVRFDNPIEPVLDEVGHVPLPPYIHSSLMDPDRYQTYFARHEGSAAAPTAGLHFTPNLIDNLQSQGIHFARVLLHVGLDTFAPVNEDSPLDHKIHSEWCLVSRQTTDMINRARKNGRRVVAVGTTSVRAIESAGQSGSVTAYEGSTDLFILPGYRFKVVDSIITNFHLPRSTLILLVSAFAGRETILNAYQVAIDTGYRFYSFGDAMLIL
jgi:S-adenosylmethionine:tRNA ribosyltransferase-isomerase